MCHKIVLFFLKESVSTLACMSNETLYLQLQLCVFIHFPVVPNLQHRAPFGVSVITHTIRHAVGRLWTSDQPVSEVSTYTGKHNI
jgi:hypothetical protein